LEEYYEEQFAPAIERLEQRGSDGSDEGDIDYDEIYGSGNRRVVREAVTGERYSRGYSKRVSVSENSGLPANRGRHRDTRKTSKQSYTPSVVGKCKKGYYYDPKRKLCIKY
jgi:hypothetical protein